LSEGGTSAAAPFWAGLIALADQEAGHPLGVVNSAIYRIARSPKYLKAFHDVTTGNNTVVVDGVTMPGYQAGPGWDPVTGWGTPDAQVFVPAARPLTRRRNKSTTSLCEDSFTNLTMVPKPRADLANSVPSR
jgi:subtilase family serine protease